MNNKSGIKILLSEWLSRNNGIILTAYLSIISFLLYACMYGLRKPFTVAQFNDLNIAGIDYKSFLIISQVAGYAVSKFIGIRFIAEMKRKYRALSIVILTGIAEFALIMFGIVPAPYNSIFLFFNGLPLGMIWGLVFSYLEGRRTTEILGTALSISFIVSSGFVKSTGKILMETFRLNDFQMPWITGMIFIIPLTGLVWLLNCAPDPSPEDVKERSKRVPMDKKLRRKIFGEFSAGLILLTAAYILLTIFRDLRDNFAADIWKATGFSENSMILTWSEIPVAVLVYIIMSSLILVKNNRTALFLNISLILSGFAVIGLSTSLLQTGIINAATWIIMLGLGTYMGYLPFNCLLFDRLIAAFGSTANAGFFIYIADSFGYLGSVGTLLFKNFSSHNISWYGFLVNSSLSMAFTGGFLLVFTIIYFYFKFPGSARAKNKIPFNELNDYQH